MKVPYNKSPVQSDIVAAWYDSYFSQTAKNCAHAGSFESPIGKGEPQTDVYITCFGNNFFAEHQIKTLKKFFVGFFAGDVNIILVDNNCHHTNGPVADLGLPSISRELLGIANPMINKNCYYIRPPHNHYQEKQHFDPSMKLGTTLSWLFHNVIKLRQPEQFFFLDQDCFLFRNFEFKFYLWREMYGTVCENKPKWNIHVTQCGFLYGAVKDLPLDFRPSWKHNLDTGGANYDILYAHRNIENFRLKHTGVRFFKEDTVSGIRPQHYEIIDDCWIHLCASTHDALEGEGQRKLDYIKGFLDCALIPSRY